MMRRVCDDIVDSIVLELDLLLLLKPEVPYHRELRFNLSTYCRMVLITRNPAYRVAEHEL